MGRRPVRFSAAVSPGYPSPDCELSPRTSRGELVLRWLPVLRYVLANNLDEGAEEVSLT